MNYLDFFASVIGSITSLAWPAAVVTAVWLFRGEIRPLLPRLHLKHKDTEISFHRRLEDAEIVVERLPAPPQEPAPATPEELSRFEQLVAISPRTALMEIRREAEEAVGRAGTRAGYRTFGGARGTMRMLRKHMVIDESTSKLLDDLFAIGNAAAHDPHAAITADDARRYRVLADRLIDTLDNPPPRDPSGDGDF
ncbi:MULTISPECIES: DUF4145 domain-containing protein [unclassified Mesorhizobium]|uniref:DUF4145 domain-containing protein n=1 Tax=unclassified Mesorhizobium TaxID=325217 RepID=UPI000FCB8D00|nr:MULTISPECIES: DUF4145 domain-containing protein [unclassified Mesorhizobium]RUX97159.1 DUF4145 domain-containing protein [Mesorhizobium sp. M7D.F.Ca.US.004.01.2.1]RVA28285.1 DUF4145 domain-containing protein [Mesorhizobium sp. M7D.F.Ca.US.004.03.1.1]